MDVQPNTPRGLTDHGTVFEGIINALDGVVLHADQETRAQLGVGSPSIKKCG